ncbi:MAG: CMP-N,N'-diacetyllegionaminic acid synthase [Psychroserpens sp.]|jgi:CMP-N,N'-diacetyllegionaminic acid synthase
MITNKILAIIPARGGSKGIPNKNIIDIGGKPLIEYSISPALALKKSKYISEVIVSTDSVNIKNIAENLGVSVPFLRPESIAGDEAKSIDFIKHALEYFESKDVFFDAVLLLQPTSPLRTYNMLIEAIDIYMSSNSESLISCYKEEYINDLVMYRKSKKSNFLEPLNRLHNKGVRRQEHGEVFVRNGAIYLTKTSYLKSNSQIISDNPVLFEMKKNESINIDGKEDIELLKKYI